MHFEMEPFGNSKTLAVGSRNDRVVWGCCSEEGITNYKMLEVEFLIACLSCRVLNLVERYEWWFFYLVDPHFLLIKLSYDAFGNPTLLRQHF